MNSSNDQEPSSRASKPATSPVLTASQLIEKQAKEIYQLKAKVVCLHSLLRCYVDKFYNGSKDLTREDLRLMTKDAMGFVSWKDSPASPQKE